MASLKGSQVMDPIIWDADEGYGRQTNHLGALKVA